MWVWWKTVLYNIIKNVSFQGCALLILIKDESSGGKRHCSDPASSCEQVGEEGAATASSFSSLIVAKTGSFHDQ